MRSLGQEQPAWLVELRENAKRRFESLGYPTKKNEGWRYTSVRPISSASWGEASTGKATYTSPIKSSVQLVFVNGFFQASQSASGLDQSVTVLPFGEALKDESNALAEVLRGTDALSDEAFVALNDSEFSDGAFVQVKSGVELDLPIELVFIATEGARIHPRIAYSGGPNSRATLVERYVATTELSYLTNTVSQVQLHAGAKLEHVRIQDESLAAYHIGFTSVHQARDSSYEGHTFSLGGQSGRSEIQTTFAEPGGTCSLNGLYAPTSGQNHDNYTVIDHANPHCTSSEYYKAIVSDKATGSFQGRVLIQEGAVGSCSDQLNRNLLLGEAAVANTKPQLEIDNDDVKATHGSTVGRLDPDAVFYLMARGLPKNEARAFLVRAFAGELIEKVSAEDLRADLVAMFDVRLEQVGSVV